ncbi:MAG: PolC-type DNA polymerase III [Bacilli bacterium]|nr:PolC-type DNA polymerase III [Bacilli bacterium]
MDNNLAKLLDKIEITEDNKTYYKNAILSKVLCNKLDNNYCFVINIDKMLPVDIYDEFITKLESTYSNYNSVIASFNVKEIDKNMIGEYYKYLLTKYSKKHPLIDLFSENKLEYNDNLTIEVDNTTEKTKLETVIPNLTKDLMHIGFGKIKIDIVINDEYSRKFDEEIKKELDRTYDIPKVEVKENRQFKFTKGMHRRGKTEEGCILGKHIEGHIDTISSIQDEEDTVTIEATIFGMDVVEVKGGLKIATIKLTDYTDSMYMKMFARTDDQYETILKLKEGKWYRLRGYIKYDEYAHELVFNPRDIEEIEKVIDKRKDEEDKKRVELHAHTMMSQMDGVCDEVALVKKAIEFGHPGIAITDHDCCQAFPHVFGEVTGYNKGLKKAAKAKVEEIQAKIDEAKKNNEDTLELEQELESAKEEQKNLKFFKAIYGTEIEMTESTLNVCYNPNDALIDGNTYVIFDTETTGFNPGLGDSMIEIGGVKIKDGEILDRFDELINPGHHIDEAITAVTEISDEDVKDAKNEEEVTKMFKEWIGDLPLVAHNATFDKNMLDMAYYKYNLGELKNPIIDTLMLSRVINRDLKKHSLKALGKFYGVDTGEADEDEEATSSNTSVKLDDRAKNSIKDIIVNGESVLVSDDKDSYIRMKHLASKSEKANVEILLLDGNKIEEEVSLHPAMNEIDISYNPLDSVRINVYVGVHHGADVDSENTGYIFIKMLRQISGIKALNDLNNLGLLEDTIFTNDRKLQDKIDTLCTYKNYIRPLGEDEEVADDRYPFIKFNNKKFVWKYEWCHNDYLQMYENIPGKTFTENIANIYSRGSHVTFLAKDHKGLKNLFKIVSYANSNFLERNARIPRRLIEENRDGLLIGSACLSGEIFDKALTRTEEDLCAAMEFYDYIEVQPLENYRHLLRRHDINNEEALENAIKKIIKCAKKMNKLIVATGDVHNIEPEDLISREIIVNQNVPGKGRHILAKYLRGESKYNPNIVNIDKLLKHTTYSLSDVDIKVLKYIYALYNIKNIPITLDNITEIYTIDKANKDEEKFKAKDFDKKSYLATSLRNLEAAEIIIEYSHGDEILYTFAENFKYFTKTDVPEMGHIPNQYFRTTKEMKDAFMFLDDDELVEEIVVTNPNKILDMVEEIEVVEYPDKPYSPIIEHSQETCRDLVYDKAHSMYGNPLPRLIEERIAQEFYGDKILGLVEEKIKLDNPDYDDKKVDEVFLTKLHEIIMSGYDGVVDIMKDKLMREDSTLEEEQAKENAKASLGGIIGGGFDVIYLIAQKLVKHSNDDGYLVGSRGSVGSSFVASMMGITECNGLPPHYYCPNCQYSMFEDENGVKFTEEYSSGYDLPNRDCPKCKTLMIHQGNDMPFATFLGFNADKVPDIDLNFSGDNQASAHEYTKVLFGTDNVYRAGTIGTVADKTAVGYALGFFEEEMYNALYLETASLGLSIPGKDDLKKKGVIKSSKRNPEVERIAVGCTGVKRTTGQHPGGIVVVPGYKDVWDFTPFQYPADDPTVPWRTTHFDYHAIDADLLKLDILGHDDPTVLRLLQDMTGVDVTNIDLGDQDTMKIFTGPEVLGVEKDRLRGLTKDGRKYCPTGTLGVPEFGTSFLLGMLEETKPKTFAELIKISGLSHGTDVWLGNARDLCTPDSNGNIRVPFKNVIGCRDDIMVNLIQWGMKPAKAFKIMEFVRKGKASKDPATWEGFAKEMTEAGIPDWYIDSCRKIKYMFPKAHATAYVTSAFRIAWFKVHMPIYYYAAYFSIRCEQFDIASMIQGEDAIRRRIDELEAKIADKKASNKETQICDVLYSCLEMTARGFHFENVDINKSDAKYFKVTEDEKGLIIPFSAIDGLGDAVATSIVKQRNKSPFISIEDLNNRTSISGTIVEYMKISGMLGDMPESNQLSLF